MSDMITLPETEEGKIVYIVETMRDSIFRALDNNKRGELQSGLPHNCLRAEARKEKLL